MFEWYALEKPSVVFLKSVHKDVIYYKFGKVYTFEFYTSGYPLPDEGVNCHFKSCQNFPWCNDNETQAQVNNSTRPTLFVIATLQVFT